MEENSASTILGERHIAQRISKAVIGLEAVLVVDGELESFLNKLEVHLIQVSLRDAARELVLPSVDLLDIRRGDAESGDVRTLSATGSYTNYRASYHPDFPLLKFYVRRFPRGDQLQLTAKFVNFLELFDCFEDLLSTLVRLYPVAGETVYTRITGVPETPDYGLWQRAARQLESRLIALSEGERSDDTEEEARRSHHSDVPKTQEFRDRWKRAYKVIRETREEYRRTYGDWEREEPSPKPNDYRDALGDKMNWTPTTRTIQKIIKAGDAGELD